MFIKKITQLYNIYIQSISRRFYLKKLTNEVNILYNVNILPMLFIYLFIYVPSKSLIKIELSDSAPDDV